MTERLTSKIILDKDYRIGKVDKRLFGSFIEHLGRAVYTGIYEPGHPEADEEGFRTDVMKLVKELDVPIIRYPGGNFVSAYNWEDGIGPQDNRSARLDLAWRTIEPNTFGLHEFMSWTKKVNSSALMAVNLGTRGIDDARNLLEYCNLKERTYWSDLRKVNGASEPFGIKTWCLGNEMDGPWQIGHKTSYEYGRIASETAKAMRLVDPDIELVSCGSSKLEMPTFPSWEAETLEQTYDFVDYISMHQYFGNWNDDSGEYLSKSLEMDDFINTVVSVCDYMKSKKRSRKVMNICFDEWNIWFHNKLEDKKRMREGILPTGTSLLEEHYNLEDALLVGSMLITLLRHADRVKIACIAQLVNVIAPIIVEKDGSVWRQTIFFPLLHASMYGRGDVLMPIIESPGYQTEKFESVSYIESIAVMESECMLTVFVVNKNIDNPVVINFDLRAFPGIDSYEHILLTSSNIKDSNSAYFSPVVPVHHPVRKITDKSLEIEVPKASWNVFRLKMVINN